MRLFIAVAFDSAAKAKMFELNNVMRSEGITGSFTPAENLHLTLKFLGEVENDRIAAVKAALDNAAGALHEFDINSVRYGFFTSRGEKTVWLSMDGAGLSQLAEAVDTEISGLGFEREKRAFTPHITVARRAVCDADILSHMRAPDIAFTVKSATLFESRRDGGRLWYKPVHSAKLGAR
jgi:RNA 2',3'-cyclic 3'-phosphodiesterase